MFTTRMSEARTSKVELQDVSFATVEAVVKFAYTANIRLNDSNVQDLLSAANQYQVTTLVLLFWPLQSAVKFVMPIQAQ